MYLTNLLPVVWILSTPVQLQSNINSKCRTPTYRSKYCFWLETLAEKWSDALGNCEKNNATLAILDDEEISNFVVIELPSTTTAWIGLTDGHTKGVFRWTNSKAANWVKWAENGYQPISVPTCVQLINGNWKNLDCTTALPYYCMAWDGGTTDPMVCDTLNEGCLGVRNDTWECSQSGCMSTTSEVTVVGAPSMQACQMKCQKRTEFQCRSCSYDSGTSQCVLTAHHLSIQQLQHGCSDGSTDYVCRRTTNFRSWSNTCIIPGDFPLSSDEAHQWCEQRNASLLTVRSNAEHVAIISEFGDAPRHIGLVQTAGLQTSTVLNLQQTAAWKWRDGSYPEWQIWGNGHPDFSVIKNCGIYDGGMWKTANCVMESLPFLCEVPNYVFCESFPPIANADHYYNATTNDVVYQCHNGFLFADGFIQNNITCDCGVNVTESLMQMGKCHEICTELPTASNSQPSVSNASVYGVDQQVVYICDSVGYVFPSGEPTIIITCLSKDTWDITVIPYCSWKKPAHCQTDILNGRCFWVSTVQKSWAESLAFCEENNGTLAMITDQETHNFILTNYNDLEVWIGLSNGHTAGVFRWVNTAAATWTKWEDFNSDNCVLLQKPNGLWRAKKCTYEHKAICMAWDSKLDLMKCDQLTDGCLGIRTDIWTCQDNMCVNLVDVILVDVQSLNKCQQLCQKRVEFNCRSVEYDRGTKSCKLSQSLHDPVSCNGQVCSRKPFWSSNRCLLEGRGKSPQGALEFCKSEGGTLLSVHSQEEHDSLMNQVIDVHTETIVGLMEPDFSMEYGTWRWSDGTYPEWQVWKDGPKEDTHRDCVIYRDQRWEQVECEKEFQAFLCETKCEVTTSAISTTVPYTIEEESTVQTTNIQSTQNDIVSFATQTSEGMDKTVAPTQILETTDGSTQLFPVDFSTEGSTNDAVTSSVYESSIVDIFDTTTVFASTTAETTTLSTATEITVEGSTKPGTQSATEITTKAAEEITTKPATEITTKPATEIITPAIEITTKPATEIITPPAIEIPTQPATEIITTSATKITTKSATEITSQATDLEITSKPATVITAPLATEMITKPATSSSTASTIVSSTTTLMPEIQTKIPRCLNTPQIPNAFIVESLTLIGGYSIYRCNEGYVFQDKSITRTIYCMEGGVWNTDITAGCIKKQCTPIIVQQNIKSPDMSVNVFGVNSELFYKCELGHKFQSGLAYDKVLCMQNMQWSHQLTNCLKRCNPLPYIENGYVLQPANNTMGSSVMFVCNKGHRFTDGKNKTSIQCQSNGEWQDISNCIVDVCPALTVPRHASISTNIAVFETEVIITCNDGYTFSQNTSTLGLQCLELGKWNDTVTACIEVTCPPPPSVANSMTISSGTSYGDTVHYNCTFSNTQWTYRHLDGHIYKQITCTQKGVWSSLDLSCELERCEPLPVIPNAVPDNTNASFGNVVNYTCDTGHVFPNGVAHAFALCDGSWNITHTFSCIKHNCGPVPIIPYASISTPTHLTYGSVAMMTCSTGYRIGNNMTGKLFCGSRGLWEPTLSDFNLNTGCQAVSCGQPPLIINAQHSTNYDHTTYNAVIPYICRRGFWFSRNLTSVNVTCSSEGIWMPEVTECTAVQCPVMESWNGIVTNTSSREYGTYVNVTCIESMILSDGSQSQVLHCTINGTWNTQVLKCVDLIPPRPFNPQPEEAKGSFAVGFLGVTLVISVFTAIVIVDLPALIIALGSLNSNIRSCTSKKEQTR